jgi:hypothetical protein
MKRSCVYGQQFTTREEAKRGDDELAGVLQCKAGALAAGICQSDAI